MKELLPEVGVQVLFYVKVERDGGHTEGIFMEDEIIVYPVVKMATGQSSNKTHLIPKEYFLILGLDKKYHYVDSQYCKLAVNYNE